MVAQTQAQAETASTSTTDASPRSRPAGECFEGQLNKEPLQEILASQASSTQNQGSDANDSRFSAYAVDAGDADPLVRVLHELIDHTAKQDARITQLCQAIESMGKKVDQPENASIDADRLNKLVE
jgi:serine O-acetyltransferase